MYTKLEEAINMLQFVQHLPSVSSQVRRIAELAEQSILEYIEEGYRLPTENNPLGN